MRILAILLLFALSTSSRAVEWQNDLFGCAVNLPDSAGWQPIEANSSADITMLVAMQHPQRQAVFGVSVLHNLPGKSLRDDANIAAIEKLLASMAYKNIGHSVVTVANRAWMQFPVTGTNAGQPVSGIIRYTLSPDGDVFGVSMLVGGGKEASQDAELQNAAASFRIIPRAAAVAANPPIPAAPAVPETPAAPAETAPAAEPEVIPGVPANYFRWGLIGLGILIVIVVLSKIIGGGDDEKAPPRNPQSRL